jgi:hypothetical protein
MIFMAILLGLLALVVGLDGANSLTQATLGVGTIASACLLAVFARIFQASGHHKEVMEALRAARAIASSASPTAEQITCEWCHTVQARGPAKCQKCGGSLQTSPSSAAPAEKPSMIQCAECKKIGPIGPEYCPNCGNRYRADESDVPLSP